MKKLIIISLSLVNLTLFTSINAEETTTITNTESGTIVTTSENTQVTTTDSGAIVTTSETSIEAISENTSTGMMIGGDRDAHGCIGSAGYIWNSGLNKCARPWENNGSGSIVIKKQYLNEKQRNILDKAFKNRTKNYFLKLNKKLDTLFLKLKTEKTKAQLQELRDIIKEKMDKIK